MYYIHCVVPDTKPAIMFYTNQTNNPGGRSTVVVGLEGQTVSLRCFFSGRSDHSIQRTLIGHVNSNIVMMMMMMIDDDKHIIIIVTRISLPRKRHVFWCTILQLIDCANGYKWHDIFAQNDFLVPFECSIRLGEAHPMV